MAGVREFEEAAMLEIHQRGIEKLGVVCAVNDGAAWCQSFVDYHREDAIRKLDQSHAFEHLGRVGRTMFGEESVAFSSWFKSQRDELKQGVVLSYHSLHNNSFGFVQGSSGNARSERPIIPVWAANYYDADKWSYLTLDVCTLS